MGGILYYFKEVKVGKSVVQNIDDICFLEGGLLWDEFMSFYLVFFEKVDCYIEVVWVLGKKWKGFIWK